MARPRAGDGSPFANSRASNRRVMSPRAGWRYSNTDDAAGLGNAAKLPVLVLSGGWFSPFLIDPATFFGHIPRDAAAFAAPIAQKPTVAVRVLVSAASASPAPHATVATRATAASVRRGISAGRSRPGYSVRRERDRGAWPDYGHPHPALTNRRPPVFLLKADRPVQCEGRRVPPALSVP